MTVLDFSDRLAVKLLDDDEVMKIRKVFYILVELDYNLEVKTDEILVIYIIVMEVVCQIIPIAAWIAENGSKSS